ncbi:hypothetical protein ACFLYA_01745 [Candidatus Dependentiae bacterium]
MRMYVVCFSLFLLFLNGSLCAKVDKHRERKEKIVLDGPLIGLVDGLGIDGQVFGVILQSRRKMKKRLYGFSTADGTLVGMFEFEGETYCLLELAKMESDNENEYISQLNDLERNRSAYADDDYYEEKAAIEQRYKERKDALLQVLEVAKEDFIAVSSLYLESAKGMKAALLLIIKEYCQKRGLEKCFLLDWGETEEGGEEESIRENVKAFSNIVNLCTDMIDFLEVMARSCPKAKVMFVEMIRNAKEEKEANSAG